MRVYSDSLARTIDAVNDIIFFGRSAAPTACEKVATWIAKRQGKPGSYANMFAPTSSDLMQGIRLFTGERVTSGASLRHISGEEACRVLILLNSRTRSVRSALEKATSGIMSRLGNPRKSDGFFCCGTCDPALWRHIAAGGLRGAEKWLSYGLKTLTAHRSENGRWRRFPFFYTLLTLSEIDLPQAIREIKYAAPACERYLARTKATDQVRVRRQAVVERALARC
jgi:hypothetical protein